MEAIAIGIAVISFMFVLGVAYLVFVVHRSMKQARAELKKVADQWLADHDKPGPPPPPLDRVFKNGQLVSSHPKWEPKKDKPIAGGWI